jgi:hypothetical protein
MNPYKSVNGGKVEVIFKVTQYSALSIVWHCDIFRDGEQLFASDPTDVGASQNFHLEIEISNCRNVVLFMEHTSMDKDQNSSNCKNCKNCQNITEINYQ